MRERSFLLRHVNYFTPRDVSEALSRIAEKSAIISSQDNGRDLKAVQSLIRKHESFENDLVALEAQLQVLIDDSASLQSRYADLSGPHIAHQQKVLLQAWNDLQDKVSITSITNRSHEIHIYYTLRLSTVAIFQTTISRQIYFVT